MVEGAKLNDWASLPRQAFRNLQLALSLGKGTVLSMPKIDPWQLDDTTELWHFV